MSDGYPSHDKAHLAKLQRQRRAAMRRIDYMPGRQALAVFEARQARERLGSIGATNSALLDAILVEWAELTGIKWKEVRLPKSLSAEPVFPEHSARARVTSVSLPELIVPSRARARAYDSGKAGNRKIAARPCRDATTCGASRHRDGQPCQARPEPGKRRCRFHGGRSTGPKTRAGKARALANLRQNRSLK